MMECQLIVNKVRSTGGRESVIRGSLLALSVVPFSSECQLVPGQLPTRIQ